VDEVEEVELLSALEAGTVLDCSDGSGRRRLDAAMLRRCCRAFKDQVDPHGIRLRNAAVSGPLDLAGLNVPFPLRFEECSFDSPIMAEGAELADLAVIGCKRFPGLLANGLSVRRDLDLSGSHVTGSHATNASRSAKSAVWLCEADIGGSLLFAGTVIEPDEGRALHADRLRVGGSLRFTGAFRARGEICLIGARVTGFVQLTGAQLDNPSGTALNLTDAVVEGSTVLVADNHGARCVIHGLIDLSSARIAGQLLIRKTDLSGSAGTPSDSGYSRNRASGTAISAQRLKVGAEVTIDGNSTVHGGMDLSMSSIGRLLIDFGCALHAPGKTALDLTNTEILSSFVIGGEVPIQGTLRLTGALIRGNLNIRGIRLSAVDSNRYSPALIDAPGVRIEGDAELQGIQAEGGSLDFRGAFISGVINISQARVDNPDGHSVSLMRATVKGSVIAYGIMSTGMFNLTQASTEGRFLCSRAAFECPRPTAEDGVNGRGLAIEAISANFASGMDMGWDSVSPSADFSNTVTSFLADDPARWPATFVISGFRYERLESPLFQPPRQLWDHEARCAWLARQSDAGPYEQAARVFRQHGYGDGAREILIAQRRAARSAITGPAARPRRILDAAYGLTVSYGYRPARVLWLIGALLIVVTISLQVPGARATMRATTATGAVYTPSGPLQPGNSGPAAAGQPGSAQPAETCGDGQIRCFNSVLYAIDTVIPLISLDQRSTWYPDAVTPDGTIMEWWLNVAVMLGWLLSSIFVLSFASFARTI
jgi:hypothetical protein